jgi:hypothetical protein
MGSLGTSVAEVRWHSATPLHQRIDVAGQYANFMMIGTDPIVTTTTSRR